MGRLGRLSTLLLVFLFLPQSVFAKITTKSTLVTPNIELGDQVQIVVEYTSDESSNALGSKIRPPQSVSDGALEFIGTNQSSSSSYSFSNGKSTSTYTRTFTLTYGAYKEGTWTVPAFDLGLGDGKKAGPFVVKVYKKLPEKYKKEKAQKRKKSFGGLLDQMFGGGFDNAFNKTPVEDVGFFAEAEVDKTKVYKGEQIFVRFYIYASGVITQFDTLKFPTFEGFWKEDVNFAGRFVWQPVIKNGKRMQRAELSSYILIPYKEGNHVVDSFELRASVTPRRFGFGRGAKLLKYTTKPIKIDVLPLGENTPESYQGGVGLFASGVVGGRDRREVVEGQAFRVQVKVVGDKSNAKFVEAPRIDLNDDFKLLSQQEEYKFFPQSLSSMKVFTYNLIPKKPGVYKIPDVLMSFHKAFEESQPLDELYYEVTQELPTLKVRANPNKKKMDDEVYIVQDDEVVWTKFSKTRVLDFLSFRVHGIFFLIFFFGVVGYAAFLFKNEVSKTIEDDQLFKKLKHHSLVAKKDFKAGRFESSATNLINYYYLIVGGITGKRLSTEEEFSRSVNSLPAGLKSKKMSIIKAMETLQEIRFGSDLSQKQNQDKLKKCIQKQIADAKALESYIS